MKATGYPAVLAAAASLGILLTATRCSTREATDGPAGTGRAGRVQPVGRGAPQSVRNTSRATGALRSPGTPALAGEGRKAEDFPYNLKTFDRWHEISAEEMRKYQRSLMSRVGRWDADGVGAFFHRTDPQIRGGEAQAIFRQTILGVWCAKDADQCLAAIDETLDDREAIGVKQEAFVGWAEQDWLIALRYLQRHGDAAIERTLGGDSTRFISAVVREVAFANGVGEAAGLAASLGRPKNRAAADAVLGEFENGR